MNSIEEKLLDLGITLHEPAAPVANYLPAVIIGSQLVISGQLCFNTKGEVNEARRGKLGEAVTTEAGQVAARLCAINLLAQAKAALGGDLNRIRRCVRLGGFINAVPTYDALPLVISGASNLMVEVLGDVGRHARSTVGVAQLPLNCAVEVEGVFEIS